MDIEEVREFALGLNEQVTEELFAEQWISWRIAGKLFVSKLPKKLGIK